MRRRPPVRAPAFLLAVLAALLVPALAVGASATPAAVDPADAAARTATAASPPLRLDLLDVSPAAPGPDDTLTIRGSLTNGTDSPVDGLGVALRVGADPVVTRGQLAAVAAGGEADIPLTAVRGSRAGLPTVPAGATRPWTISVPVDRLGLPGNGVYLLGLRLTGLGGAGAAQADRAELTTFLPYLPDPDRYVPTRVSWVWPLAGTPARDAHGNFTGNGLAGELASGGRLDALAAAPAAAPVTWLVDPALLEAAEALGGQHRMREDDGTGSDAVDADQAAAQWLATLRERLSGRPVAALPYGDPDAVALARHDNPAPLTEALARSRSVTAGLLDRVADTMVAWPADGFATEGALAALREAGARTVVLSSAALAPTRPPTYTPTGRARVPAGDGQSLEALVYDQGLVDALSGDLNAPGAAALAMQRLLADTAMITLERPNERRAVLVVPPTRWSPPPGWAGELLAAGQATPWIRTTALDKLSTTPVAPEYRNADLRYPDEVADRELGAGHVGRARDAARVSRSVQRILARPVDLATSHAGALLRAVSAAWRSTPDRGRAYLSDVVDTIESDAGKVRIIGRDLITLSDSRGTIPVTVANDLDQAVRVQVRAEPRVSGRLRVDPPPVLTVGAGRKATIPLEAEANANGLTQIDLRLLDASGRSFGPVAELKVNVTNYGSVGLIVVIIGGGLLLAAAIVRNVQRFRRRAHRGGARRAGTPTTAPAGAPVTEPDTRLGADSRLSGDARAQA